MMMLRFKNIIILGVIAFLMMSFLCFYPMKNSKNETMYNCSLMGSLLNFCQMSAVEHVSQWKQLFTVTQAKNLSLSLLFALFLSQVILFIDNDREYYGLEFQRFRNHFYWRKPITKLFNRLLIALSQGNIHSQIYA